MILRNIYFSFIFILLAGNFKATNDSCLKVNETQWNTISKGKDYTETFIEDESEKSEEKSKSDFKMPSADLGAFKYFFYILVAGAILFLVVKILQNINASPSIDIDKGRVFTLAEVEDKILEIDLESILKDALAAGDYRLALRINFLIIVKALSLSGKIKWTKEKTNWEYYHEIKDKVLALGFREIVEPFETIWYGEHELTESQFNRLKPTYDNFKNKITQ